MNKLAIETKTTHYVDYKDLERFAKATYPAIKDYSFVAVQECCNDSSHEFRLGGTYPAAEKDEAQEVREGTIPTYNNSAVLQALFEDGLIPAGVYIIRVSW